MILLSIITIIVAAIFTANSYKNVRNQQKALQSIRQNWGKPKDELYNFRYIAAYHQQFPTDLLTNALVSDIELEKLFEYVDRTNSKPGQQLLYNRLCKPAQDTDQLSDFDRLIEEININPTERELMCAQLQRLNKSDSYYLHQLFTSVSTLQYPAWAKLYIRFAWILWPGTLVLTIMLHNQYFFFLAMGFTLANFYFHFTNKNKIFGFAHSLPQVKTLISVALNLTRLTQTAGDKGVLKSISNLHHLKRKLTIVSIESSINKDPTDLAYGIWEFLKILFLIEPRTFINAIDEVNSRSEDIKLLFNYVGEIDAAISVNSLRAGLPYYCKPEFTANNEAFEIKDLYHPLIKDCVPNSLTARYSEGVLITGSNMSGKTTFIRSIAVNTLLSQTLLTSVSNHYRAPMLQICTSINIADSLNESKSYFQAEAISIFNIVNHVKAAGGNCLIIIDEIFRGTNTIERVAASSAILSYLTANKTFVFVSTHDLELAELLSNEYAVYSFEEMAADERLIFDYKIKPGILKHKNAIAVMKAIGYPLSVVDKATVVSEELSKKYS